MQWFCHIAASFHNFGMRVGGGNCIGCGIVRGQCERALCIKFTAPIVDRAAAL